MNFHGSNRNDEISPIHAGQDKTATLLISVEMAKLISEIQPLTR